LRSVQQASSSSLWNSSGSGCRSVQQLQKFCQLLQDWSQCKGSHQLKPVLAMYGICSSWVPLAECNQGWDNRLAFTTNCCCRQELMVQAQTIGCSMLAQDWRKGTWLHFKGHLVLASTLGNDWHVWHS